MKEHIKSISITFIAGFAIEIYPLLKDLTVQNFGKAAILALVFAGVRAGLKAVIEAFILWRQQTPKIQG